MYLKKVLENFNTYILRCKDIKTNIKCSYTITVALKIFT